MIIRTLFEFAAVVLLIYGFCHESEVAEWEHKQLIKFIRFIERKIKK